MNILKEEQVFDRNTREFLTLISRHLSSRSNMQKEEYVVELIEEESGIVCNMDPRIECYRDIHSKKESDSDLVYIHVAKYHMYDKIVLAIGEYHYFKDMVPGKYVYRLSSSGKRRRWYKSL